MCIYIYIYIFFFHMRFGTANYFFLKLMGQFTRKDTFFLLYLCVSEIVCISRQQDMDTPSWQKGRPLHLGWAKDKYLAGNRVMLNWPWDTWHIQQVVSILIWPFFSGNYLYVVITLGSSSFLWDPPVHIGFISAFRGCRMKTSCWIPGRPQKG